MPKHFDPDPIFTFNGFKADVVAEATTANGVAVDGVLCKDGSIVTADSGSIEVDTVNEATSANGVTVDGVLIKDSTVKTDTIVEKTSAAGVSIDGFKGKDGGFICADGATGEVDTINEATAGAGVTVDGALIKDGAVTARYPVVAVTADGAITVPSGNTTYFITKAGVAAMTLADPTATTHDGLRLTFISVGAHAHTLDLVTGINGGAADVGTWGGAAGDGVVIEAYQAKWYQVPGGNANVTFA